MKPYSAAKLQWFQYTGSKWLYDKSEGHSIDLLYLAAKWVFMDVVLLRVIFSTHMKYSYAKHAVWGRGIVRQYKVTIALHTVVHQEHIRSFFWHFEAKGLFYFYRFTEVRACISNYINEILDDVITHPCHNSNGRVVQIRTCMCYIGILRWCNYASMP